MKPKEGGRGTIVCVEGGKQVGRSHSTRQSATGLIDKDLAVCRARTRG